MRKLPFKLPEGLKKKAKEFWYGKPDGERRLGELYEDKTGLYKHREWRGFADTNYAFWVWLRAVGVAGKLAASGPLPVARALMRYRWMSTYLTGIAWIDRGNEGLRGEALRASMEHFYAMFYDSVRQLITQFQADSHLRFGVRNRAWYKTLDHDETIPGHLFYGFPEMKDDILAQLTTCFLNPHVCRPTITHYIDAVESIGLPADPCPLCASEAGLCVLDDYPDFSPVFLTTNQACDGSVGTSIIQDMYWNKPLYAMPQPMRFDDPDVQKFCIDEIKGAWKFIEDETGMKFDLETFKKKMAGYNQLTRFEREKWDVAANTPYNPVSGTAQALYRIFYSEVGERKIWHRTDAKVKKLMDRCIEKQIRPFPMTRHRALVWSCAPLYYSYFPTWLYNCWGIQVVMNMDSLMSDRVVRLDNEDDMMDDLAHLFEWGPMRRMAVGGQQHIYEIWENYEKFHCDLVIMFDQVACKGMDGIHGVFEDEFRRRNIPAIWVPHELMDHRTVERAEMRRAVNDYMTTVMQEEPIDPSLVEFDDSMGW